MASQGNLTGARKRTGQQFTRRSHQHHLTVCGEALTQRSWHEDSSTRIRFSAGINMTSTKRWWSFKVCQFFFPCSVQKKHLVPRTACPPSRPSPRLVSSPSACPPGPRARLPARLTAPFVHPPARLHARSPARPPARLSACPHACLLASMLSKRRTLSFSTSAYKACGGKPTQIARSTAFTERARGPVRNFAEGASEGSTFKVWI